MRPTSLSQLLDQGERDAERFAELSALEQFELGCRLFGELAR
jgi:hypothetical protein